MARGMSAEQKAWEMACHPSAASAVELGPSIFDELADAFIHAARVRAERAHQKQLDEMQAQADLAAGLAAHEKFARERESREQAAIEENRAEATQEIALVCSIPQDEPVPQKESMGLRFMRSLRRAFVGDSHE